MATILGGVLDFFRTLGVYDVLLPFILTFTIMFAILERTAIFGKEGPKDKEVTKKNLNAMVAFVTAFLVVASSKLVEVITKVSSEIIVLLLLIVFFLMMVGTFYTTAEIKEKGVHLEGAWKIGFMIFVLISLVFIFLDALVASNGQTWLEVFWNWLSSFATNTAVAAIVLIIVLIIIIVIVTRGD
ncbi:MAG TPA: hypothetical protein VJJ82_01320 [Candidatus Nanoarchaeia archaeon]|nr:hypothetical protein [Candidatus Nanoarchaeia archaeon]